MILIDTSAWVEFLRDTGSPVCRAVDELLDDELACCDVITMEVLAGARDDRHLDALRRLLARTTTIAVESADFETAAQLYRSCRGNGATVRRLNDCLIAAVAIRASLPVLHSDADFDRLAQHTPLAVVAPGP
jgi:hypothetical protein